MSMLEAKLGKVVEILSNREGVTEVLLDMDHPVKKAVNYNRITGNVKEGDLVYLNTTAATLSLGTGGYHFVMANMSQKSLSMTEGGHGMKLRYTPVQLKVPFSEEENKSEVRIYNWPLNLKDKLIFFGELHSMIPPLCTYLHFFTDNRCRIAYIMTDHGALPLEFSKNVAMLKENRLLDTTITIGSAFGGDYECVNIYTGLQTAASVDKSDIILVAMGPGIAGTGTRYGFSGLELGFYLDLAYRLGGQCCYIPRISFADKRQRHYGLSHHSLTMLREIIQAPVPIALPILGKKQQAYLLQQLDSYNLLEKHRIMLMDGRGIQSAMKSVNIPFTTMGRGIKEDPAFFYAIGAAAKYGLSIINRKDGV
jgi:hypothetical protein